MKKELTMPRSLRMTLFLALLISPLSLFTRWFGAASSLPTTSQSNDEASPSSGFPLPETIYYESDGLRLKGYLYKPLGKGPFPGYIWNHGSEKNPSQGGKLARFWTHQGFVFFAPIRSGHGDNPGEYIADEQKIVRSEFGGRKRQAFQQVAKLHERANDDVVAAFLWLKKQSFVDPTRIVVAGGSFGGIQTLLTAERDGWQHLGVRCFVAMSPAAMSWSPGWSARLSQAIRNSKAPIFLLQAQNDYNLGPSEVLGPLVDSKGSPSRYKIFPTHVMPGGDPNDHQQGHGRFFGDPPAWKDDVLKYLKDCREI